MKPFISLLFFIFLSAAIYSQSQQISQREIILGNNLISKTPIYGVEYTFPERIEHFFIDSTTNTGTFQLRNFKEKSDKPEKKGTLVYFDFSKNKLKWKSAMDYENSSVNQFDNIILLEENGQFSRVSNDDGTKLWTKQGELTYADAANEIAMSYKNNSENELEGINLKTGRAVWRREISRKNGWNMVQKKDSILYLSTDGLSKINIKNGKGWDYKTNTKKNDVGKTVGKGLLEVLIGVISGGVIEVPDMEVVSGISSNIFTDGDNVYFASRENLSKLNRNSSLEWSKTLPKEYTTKSEIFKKDSLIYMVNFGFVNDKGKYKNSGKAFIAGYDVNDGKQVFLQSFGGEDVTIEDYELKDDTLFLVFPTRVTQFAIKEDMVVEEKRFNLEKENYLQSFLRNTYTKTGDTFRKNSFSMLVADKNGKVYEMSRDLKKITEKKVGDFPLYYVSYKNFDFISAQNEVKLIDHAGNVLADLILSDYFFLKNNKIYDVQNNKLFVLDLRKIFPEN